MCIVSCVGSDGEWIMHDCVHVVACTSGPLCYSSVKTSCCFNIRPAWQAQPAVVSVNPYISTSYCDASVQLNSERVQKIPIAAEFSFNSSIFGDLQYLWFFLLILSTKILVTTTSWLWMLVLPQAHSCPRLLQERGRFFLHMLTACCSRWQMAAISAGSESMGESYLRFSGGFFVNKIIIWIFRGEAF